MMQLVLNNTITLMCKAELVFQTMRSNTQESRLYENFNLRMSVNFTVSIAFYCKLYRKSCINKRILKKMRSIDPHPIYINVSLLMCNFYILWWKNKYFHF